MRRENTEDYRKGQKFNFSTPFILNLVTLQVTNKCKKDNFHYVLFK